MTVENLTAKYSALSSKSSPLSPSSKIFIAGHRGMVGSAIVRKLLESGHSPESLVLRTSSELDLTNQQAVNAFFETEDIGQVYLAAAKVGGIHANNEYPAEFIYQNLMIQANIIHAAHNNKVQQLLFLGSSCIYPKLADQPMNEASLLTGMLESTNEPYAVAKIAGIKLCESYNRQYGRDYRSVMPTNLYGENDNFHPENSHVIPALMRRFYIAKLAQDGNIDALNAIDQRDGQIPDDVLVDLGVERAKDASLSPSTLVLSPRFSSLVKIWGSGKPKREFLHVDDMAEASIYVMNLDAATYQTHTEPMLSHINVGTGIDCTIREMAETMAEVVGFKGELAFDATKPDGAPRKLLDVSRLEKLGWQAAVPLQQGLQATYQWFLNHQQDFRK